MLDYQPQKTLEKRSENMEARVLLYCGYQPQKTLEKRSENMEARVLLYCMNSTTPIPIIIIDSLITTSCLSIIIIIPFYYIPDYILSCS